MISSDFFEMMVVFSAIVLIVKIVADYRIKTNLIKQGMVDEKVKHLFAKSQAASSLSSVKWGLVLIGIGIAFFMEEWISLTDEAVLGIMFVFAGASFLIYHMLVKLEANKTKE